MISQRGQEPEKFEKKNGIGRSLHSHRSTIVIPSDWEGRSTHTVCGPSGCDFLQHRLIDTNSSIKIFEGEILVRRMCAAVRQRQPEQQCFHSENIAEIRDNWNTSAFANQHGIALKSFLQCSLRCLTVF